MYNSITFFFLSVNNLYGNEMIKPLPYNQFHFLDNPEVFNFMAVDLRGEDGYILEVDLLYPDNLYDDHNDFPLAAETIQITQDMRSAYSTELATKFGSKANIETTKLSPNLRSKEKYVVHIANLKFYVNKGLLVTKIHRVLGFKQRPWLAPYINFNTELRKNARNKLEQDFFKLLNNSVYGKCMENTRKYVSIHLVTDAERLRKLTNKPQFKYATIFSEDLVACAMHPASVKLNKIIPNGFSILDFSKLTMYEIHYDYIKPTFGQNAGLCYMDTDSLLYRIENMNVYDQMKLDADVFDTSDFPKDHPLYSERNRKVLGKLKDETFGDPITSFVALRSKMYSFITLSGEEKKRSKGIKKAVVKKRMRFDDYLETLKEKKCMRHSFNLIRNEKHRLYSVAINKKSLSAYDGKRYILADGVHTLAYGHHGIADT